jgi:hypothetical protein
MSKKQKEPAVFQSVWPEGLQAMKRYELPCDDDGRLCDAKMAVLIDQQGDVYVSMSAYHDGDRDSRNLNPFPVVRVRTGIGGGRNRRTRQALLWLARAIELDTKESPEGCLG